MKWNEKRKLEAVSYFVFCDFRCKNWLTWWKIFGPVLLFKSTAPLRHIWLSFSELLVIFVKELGVKILEPIEHMTTAERLLKNNIGHKSMLDNILFPNKPAGRNSNQMCFLLALYLCEVEQTLTKTFSIITQCSISLEFQEVNTQFSYNVTKRIVQCCKTRRYNVANVD